MPSVRRRPDLDAAEADRAPGGPPWRLTLPLAAAALGWYLLSGEAARFAGLLAPALAAGAPDLPALGLAPGFALPAAPPAPVLAGGGAAGVLAAGGIAWVYAESRRLVHGRSTRRFLKGADKELARPVLDGVLYRDGVTLLYSPPGQGKSEFAFALVAASIKAALAVEGSADFVGLKVYPAKWYVLSEQTRRGLLPYLRRHGLSEADAEGRVIWETWHNVKRRWRGRLRQTGNPTWERVAPAAIADAKKHGCTAFVLDTLMQWTADTSGALQDVGGVRKTFDPLMTLADAGLAVLGLMHTTKAGSYAGSNALMAACDVMYRLHHPPKTPENVRELERDKSRADDSPPRHLMSLEGDGYRAWDPSKGVIRPGKAPEPGTLPPPPTPSPVAPDMPVPAAFAAAFAGEKEGVNKEEDTPNVRPNERSEVPKTDGELLLGLLTAEGISTAKLLQADELTGWDRAKLKRELDRLKAVGQAEPTGEKDGRAVIWRRKME